MASKKKAKSRKSPHSTPEHRAKVVAQICEKLRQGGCSIRQACRELDVPVQTAQDWARETEGRFGQYAQARAEGLALDVDDIHELAATKCKDQVEAASIRLQVDTLKWDVCKRIPKVYGDRTKVEHEGTLTLSQLVEQSYSSASENADPVDDE